MSERAIKLGSEIKYYIRKKWKSQAKAAKILGISPFQLSRVVTGKRAPSSELVTSLISSGFDERHFQDYFLNGGDQKVDSLTKDQVIQLVLQQKILIDQQREMIIFLSKRIDKLTNGNF